MFSPALHISFLFKIISHSKQNFIFRATKLTTMEQEQSSELFSLQIEPLSKSYLWEAARWGKFLSIVGFAMCALIVLIGIFFGSFFSFFTRNTDGYGDAINTTGLGAAMAFIYILIAIVYFFPCLFLFRFATKMKTAINGNSQEELNVSFQNLKSMFKYVGILTIIGLALFALEIIVIMFSAAAFR